MLTLFVIAKKSSQQFCLIEKLYFFLAAAVLLEYTRVRVPDDQAIADLAMYNYIEVIYFLTDVVWNCIMCLECKSCLHS